MINAKKQWLHNEYYESLLLAYPVINGNNLLTQLDADPPSSCPEWVLQHFFSCFSHLCWVPTDSFPQSKKTLTFTAQLLHALCWKKSYHSHLLDRRKFRTVSRSYFSARPLTLLCLHTGYRKLWIQATASFFVWHSTCVQCCTVCRYSMLYCSCVHVIL